MSDIDTGASQEPPIVPSDDGGRIVPPPETTTTTAPPTDTEDPAIVPDESIDAQVRALLESFGAELPVEPVIVESNGVVAVVAQAEEQAPPPTPDPVLEPDPVSEPDPTAPPPTDTGSGSEPPTVPDVVSTAE